MRCTKWQTPASCPRSFLWGKPLFERSDSLVSVFSKMTKSLHCTSLKHCTLLASYSIEEILATAAGFSFRIRLPCETPTLLENRDRVPWRKHKTISRLISINHSRIAYFWEVLKQANKAKKLKAKPVLLFVKQLRAAMLIPEAGDLLKPQRWHLGVLSGTGFPKTTSPDGSKQLICSPSHSQR